MASLSCCLETWAAKFLLSKPLSFGLVITMHGAPPYHNTRDYYTGLQHFHFSKIVRFVAFIASNILSSSNRSTIKRSGSRGLKQADRLYLHPFPAFQPSIKITCGIFPNGNPFNWFRQLFPVYSRETKIQVIKLF